MGDFVFGQYIKGNSWIYKIDARIKLISLIILIITCIIIKDLILMLSFLGGIICLIALSRLSLIRFFKSLRSIMFLMLFTFIIQLIYTTDNKSPLFTLDFSFNFINLWFIGFIIVIYYATKRFMPFRFLYFLGLLLIVFVIQHFLIFDFLFNLNYQLSLYENGLAMSLFLIVRVIIFLMLSTLFTFTTSPLEINDAIESLLKPLKKIKVPASEIAMMFMLTLRFIPLLYDESKRIMKAQASRGVDFKEGSLKKRIIQTTALIIPMLVISMQRAVDLADAMEMRGYVIGEKRTKYEIRILKARDFFALIFCSCILLLMIFWRFYEL